LTAAASSQSSRDQPQCPGLPQLLRQVAQRVRDAGVFGEVTVTLTTLDCAAKASAAPAAFRLRFEDDRLWVALVPADRWLSQSIEADLVHTGDKLEDLLGEELTDLGHAARSLPFEHFRSEDKLFTFRSIVPITGPDLADPSAAIVAGTSLLAYEACFRNLGDMDSPEE